MCNFSEGFFDRGVAVGIEQDRTNSIRTLMETMSLTVEQAMDALRVPAEERPKYLELLKRPQ